MNKPFPLIAVALMLALSAGAASAQSLTVLADPAFQPVLKDVVPAFTEQTGFEVRLVLESTDALAERIRSGAEADLVFPASEEAMKQMMEKGLVDVALKRLILLMPATEPAEDGTVPEPQRISAAVLNNAAQRLQAMAFLEYLASDPARAAFARQGFSLP